MAGHGVRGETKASENRIAAAKRHKQALELRMAGYGYQEIADKLGYEGPSGAYQAIRNALLKTLKEPADEVRALEIKRLDAMLAALWAKVRNGNEAAIDRALKIMARRAAYLGLDAPAKINVDVLVKQAAEAMELTPDEQAILQADVQAFIESQKAGVS